MPLRPLLSRMALEVLVSLCRTIPHLHRRRQQQWQRQQSPPGGGASPLRGASRRLGPWHPLRTPNRWRARHGRAGSAGGWIVTVMPMARVALKARRSDPLLQSLWPPRLPRRVRIESGSVLTAIAMSTTTTVATTTAIMTRKAGATRTVAPPPAPVPSVVAAPQLRPRPRANSRRPCLVQPPAGRRPGVVVAAAPPWPSPLQLIPHRRQVCRRARWRRGRRVALRPPPPTPPRWARG